MAKRRSEGLLGVALRQMDLETYVYKPADAPGSGLKPADYLVWFLPDPDQFELLREYEFAFVEGKDTDAVKVFNLSEIRPSQRNAIAKAAVLGIPYWLVIYWRRRRRWTISDARRIFDTYPVSGPNRSLSFETLASTFGIDCEPHQLAITLRQVMLGELFITEIERRANGRHPADAPDAP